jgi:Protein HRI1
MIPDSMTGGWVRNGISFDDGPAAEDSIVWWLQSPSQHCDLRVPLIEGGEGVMSFAGTTTWADESLTWHRELDLYPTGTVDVGVATWDGADLIETGTGTDGDRQVTYQERWQRLPGSESELLALTSGTGRIIRTGPYAITIVDARPYGGEFAAAAWTLLDGEWAVHHSWPAEAEVPTPPLSIADGQSSVVLSDGATWTVVEYQAQPH